MSAHGQSISVPKDGTARPQVHACLLHFSPKCCLIAICCAGKHSNWPWRAQPVQHRVSTEANGAGPAGSGMLAAVQKFDFNRAHRSLSPQTNVVLSEPREIPTEPNQHGGAVHMLACCPFHNEMLLGSLHLQCLSAQASVPCTPY